MRAGYRRHGRNHTLGGSDPIPGLSGYQTLNIVIEGTGAITTGVKGDVYLANSYRIVASTLLADQTGSIVLDIWKNAYGSYPPTVANTITASAIPTLSSALKAQDTTLTGWTTLINAGDTLRFNVNSATTVTRVCLALTLRPGKT